VLLPISSYVKRVPIDGGRWRHVMTLASEQRQRTEFALYPSKEALDAAVASGSTWGMSETFEQLDEVRLGLTASEARS
jgi:hypothetical protein